MALSFSEGSIGGDIESVSIARLEAFYGKNPAALARVEPDPRYMAVPPEPTGSNGFAIAPANTTAGKALLWINPHTSFSFREEAQVTSSEGLNAYGALTWGQFFIYQGFNEKAGWMHTSSGVDNIDEFLETIVQKDGKVFYKYGAEEREARVKTITIPYKTATGMATKEFTTYRTHHGPIVREQDGKWVAVSLMEQPLKALQQSYGRTKTKNIAEYKQVMELHTNSSNDTLYADADGNIAYFHSNFVPEAQPEARLEQAGGRQRPRQRLAGRARGRRQPERREPAQRLGLQHQQLAVHRPPASTARRRATSPPTSTATARTRAASTPSACSTTRRTSRSTRSSPPASTPQQPEFDVQIPLLREGLGPGAGRRIRSRRSWPSRSRCCKAWDHRWAVDSVPQSLAIFWGEELWAKSAPAARNGRRAASTTTCARKATAQQRLEALAAASDKLTADFGTWQTPWGEINRFQRISPAIVHPYSRRQAEHAGGLRLGALGLAGVVRRPQLQRQQEASTARAATASWPPSSSARTACAPAPSPPAA